jgi:hypothetical protein
MSEQENVGGSGYAEQTFTLPSRGLLYGDKLPGGTVSLRPMTVREERILFNTAKDQLGTLNRVIGACLCTKALPLDEYLIPDKFYMLLMLRVISFPNGEIYEYGLSCPYCSTEFNASADIREDFPTVVLTEEDTEPFKVTLPMCGSALELRYLRGADEKDIERYTRQAFKSSMGDEDPGYVYRMAKRIVTIDGVEVKPIEAMTFCERLLSGDSCAITEAIEEHDFGVNLNISKTCPNCQREVEQMIPFTANFFRPRSHKKTNRV